MPVLQQERPAPRLRKQLSPRSVLLRISHGEDGEPVGLGSEFFVPLRFPETAADAVYGRETFRVADGDFIGGDSHDAAVLGV